MINQKKNYVLFAIIFLVGIVCGFEINSFYSPVKQSNCLYDQKIIYHDFYDLNDFFDVDQLIYDKGYLTTKIYLNEDGKNYNNSNLFIKDYKVNVSLYNNEFGEMYIDFDEISWNIDEVLNVNLKINKEKIDKELLPDFEKQLENMKNNKPYEITYLVQVAPENNPEIIMENTGTLQIK